MFSIKVFLLNLTKKLWPKVSLFALLAASSAYFPAAWRDIIPDGVEYSVDGETLGAILNILASSMLAVTTFSLSIMVSAYSSATTTVSPRATQLVMQDHTTQNVLAAFLGGFVFSLTGIIATNMGLYRDKGRVVLFAMTLLVVAVIVVALIRWIDRLTAIGRVSDTTRQVEKVAREAMERRAGASSLGCRRMDAGPDFAAMTPLRGDAYGYVQYLDVDALARIADDARCDCYITAPPGRYVTPKTPYLWTQHPVPEETARKLRKAFTIADERTFEQDPRFGVCVLAEIAQRSMPQTKNDPGTVIDVLGRLVTVLAAYAEATDGELCHERLWIKPLDVADLFQDAFAAIARDGAALYEVQARLHKCLRHLAELDNPAYRTNAQRQSRLALARSDRAPLLDEEKEALRRLAL